MKTTLALALLGTLLGLPALAQTTATGTGTANSQSGAVAIARGGSQSITFNSPGNVNSNIRYRQSGSVNTTPNAIAPGLGSAAIETCYGPGVSGGLAVTGFGASFGMGQYDTACNRRLNARTIYAFGYKQQALRIMLNEPEVAAAFGVGQQAGGGPAPVVYRGSRPVAAGAAGCQKWSGGSPGAGVCVY